MRCIARIVLAAAFACTASRALGASITKKDRTVLYGVILVENDKEVVLQMVRLGMRVTAKIPRAEVASLDRSAIEPESSAQRQATPGTATPAFHAPRPLTEQEKLAIYRAEQARKAEAVLARAAASAASRPPSSGAANVPRIPAPLPRASTPIAAPRVAVPVAGGGHWVDSVTGDGEVVVLEDGSIWLVDAVDRIDTSVWVMTDDVVVVELRAPGRCLLINTSSRDKVYATMIGTR